LEPVRGNGTNYSAEGRQYIDKPEKIIYPSHEGRQGKEGRRRMCERR